VLLAEDSLINQKLAIGLLEKWGHRVTVANHGHEAVKLSADQPFDLLLMDVQMPELDGLDATRMIRVREQTTGIHLPIVAMTAHAMKGDRERCLAAGMDDYLVKPIRASELFQAVERIGLVTMPIQSRTMSAIPSDQIDWQMARRAVNEDEELLQQVLEAFLEEGPQLLVTMQESVIVHDLKRFQRATHTLKSGLRMFGIMSLAEDVEQLELAAKNQDLPEQASGVTSSVTQRTEAIFAKLRTGGLHQPE
jgi:hypothetical protein